jgi:hypothetical protein
MFKVRHPRLVSLQASLAELMLVNRLRARTRRDLALDTLQRGADIIELTAKHWFADGVHSHDEQSNLRSPIGVL